jgi:hypothetical protein
MRFSIYFIFSLVISIQVNAQTSPTQANNFLGSVNSITTAVPFLLITPDARAGGMGETGVATSPDVNAMYWNPAKLPFENKKMGVAVSYTPWLRALVPDVNLAYVSFYSKLDSVSAIGASLRYLSMGNISFAGAGGTTGQFRPNDFAFDGSYSRRLGKYFSVGMSARYIRSTIANVITTTGVSSVAGTSFAMDLGGYYYNNQIRISGKESVLMMGAAITNAGSKMSYPNASKEFLPINFRLGQGIQINLDSRNQIGFQYEFNKMLVPSPPVYAMDGNGSPVINGNGGFSILAGKDPNVSVPQGMVQSFYDSPEGFKGELREITASAGAEYWYKKIVAVRTGYFYENKSQGNRQYLTLGAGIKYNVFGLDFAYLIPTNGQRSPLQNTLRFTLLFDFDKFR